MDIPDLRWKKFASDPQSLMYITMQNNVFLFSKQIESILLKGLLTEPPHPHPHLIF